METSGSHTVACVPPAVLEAPPGGEVMTLKMSAGNQNEFNTWEFYCCGKSFQNKIAFIEKYF